MSTKSIFIERLRYEFEICSLEYKRRSDAYKKMNIKYENNPTPENREKRAISWKNYREVVDKSDAAWEKYNNALDCRIAASGRDNRVEASPLKVIFLNN